MKRTLSLFAFLILSGIFLSGQSITLTEPHAGASWNAGGTYVINWTKTGAMGGNVKIRLRQGATKVLDIVDSTPNNGSYSWAIPATLAPGTYTIRIVTLDNAVSDNSAAFNIAAAAPATVPARRLEVPRDIPPRIGFPALSISNVRVSPIAEGFVITFGYKNSGTGSMPRASAMPEKPDYSVLVDGRVLTRGRLFFPESPAPPGWEVDAFHGGQINYPVPKPDLTFAVGDTLTVKINENRVNGMASDSRSVNLRELALGHSYDLHVTSVSANWTDETIYVHVRIDGLLPTDKEILLINNPYQCQFDAVVKMNPGQRNYVFTQKLGCLRWCRDCVFDLYVWLRTSSKVVADAHDIDQRNNEYQITLHH